MSWEMPPFHFAMLLHCWAAAAAQWNESTANGWMEWVKKGRLKKQEQQENTIHTQHLWLIWAVGELENESKFSSGSRRTNKKLFFLYITGVKTNEDEFREFSQERSSFFSCASFISMFIFTIANDSISHWITVSILEDVITIEELNWTEFFVVSNKYFDMRVRR